MKLLTLIFVLILTACAPSWRSAPPDGPDAPQLYDPIHGPNYGPQP